MNLIFVVNVHCLTWSHGLLAVLDHSWIRAEPSPSLFVRSCYRYFHVVGKQPNDNVEDVAEINDLEAALGKTVETLIFLKEIEVLSL